MTPKQTVSLHACLISRILVHDCVFAVCLRVCLLLAAVQVILATRAPLSCSPCLISPLGGQLHHHGNNVNPSGIELQPTVISPGIVLGPPPSVLPSMNSMTGRAPPDSRLPKASPTTLFRARVIWTVVKSTGKLCYGRLLQLRGVPSMDWLDKAWNK